jgi:hypothetical protein
MAYLDVSHLVADADFNARVAACYATETLNVDGATDPASWAAVHAWEIAAQPGFGDAYAGGGSEAISDAQILTAVQAIGTP